METRTTEVADGIYQFTTYIADFDFSFNQYLVTGDEPLLFHTGGRQLFPLIKDAVATVIPPETLRWVSFGHVESDESGSMNEWLAVAPNAEVRQSATGCMVSLNDLCDRPPVVWANGETVDIGGRPMTWIDTPHIPHGWETGVLYDVNTKTLLCGDLFTRGGPYDATNADDIMGPAIATEDFFHSWALAPDSGKRVRALTELDIATLALMHGPAWTGDCGKALLELADDVDRRIAVLAG